MVRCSVWLVKYYICCLLNRRRSRIRKKCVRYCIAKHYFGTDRAIHKHNMFKPWVECSCGCSTAIAFMESLEKHTPIIKFQAYFPCSIRASGINNASSITPDTEQTANCFKLQTMTPVAKAWPTKYKYYRILYNTAIFLQNTKHSLLGPSKSYTCQL